MNPQEQFCPNSACHASGKVGGGNIKVHSRKEKRYRCRCCGKTFSERSGTAMYGIKKPDDLFVQVTTLLAYGCPPQAIVAAFELDERTVGDWHQKAGNHCQQGPRPPSATAGCRPATCTGRRNQGQEPVWLTVDGAGHHGVDPVVAGRCRQPETLPAVDPKPGRSSSHDGVVPAAAVCCRWVGQLYQGGATQFSFTVAHIQTWTSSFDRLVRHSAGSGGQAAPRGTTDHPTTDCSGLTSAGAAIALE